MSTKKIRKVVIPAAGLGTRFLPATKSQPKEMLPIVDKPCIQYLVEEAVASGIKEIIIVTGRSKRAIEDHFDFSYELTAHLKKNQKTEAIKELNRIERLAKFIYVRQPYPLGDGDAILCAKELLKDEPFAVLFGDDIWDAKTPPLKQLISQYEKTASPVFAITEIPKKDSDKYGIIETQIKKGRLHKIKNLIEKPTPEKAPSSFALTGKYIITPELLNTLSLLKRDTKKELRLIDGMREFAKTHALYGYEIDGQRFDTGDKLGYLKAVFHFALKRKEFAKELKSYLEKNL